MTGKGFSLGIIDDPLKNAEEAASELIREKQKDWYASTFCTREEPDGAQIIVQTRWHEDDLSGFLLSDENSEESEGWYVLSMAALSDDPNKVYASFTLPARIASELRVVEGAQFRSLADCFRSATR